MILSNSTGIKIAVEYSVTTEQLGFAFAMLLPFLLLIFLFGPEVLASFLRNLKNIMRSDDGQRKAS